MKIEQLIKKLNNTELGKTGTHETYVQVPTNLGLSNIFPVAEQILKFTDKDTLKQYEIRLTVGRENRICGLGQYYRDFDLNAGDELLLEKLTIDEDIKYFISYRKLENTIVVKKSTKGYEVLTPERLAILSESTVEEKSGLPFDIRFIRSERKRADSPDVTDYYGLFLGDEPYKNLFNSKDIIEIQVRNNKVKITAGNLWETLEFEQED